MKKAIPVSRSDFEEIITGDFYYVDKTLIIEELLRKKPGVLLITRPRRFGKTLNMSTMKYFFDINNAKENRELFRSLNIESTEYMSEQGKYPVIHITMKELGGLNYDEFFLKFKTYIGILFNKYEYLRVELNERDLVYFDKVWLEKEGTDYSRALSFLCEQLYKYYGIKPVLLIDEYDAPMMDGEENGYYEKVKVLIGSLYGTALKEGCTSYAVITGVLKVAKESIFSTLNNLDVSTILTGDYNHFGMREDEVLEILKYYGWETTIEDTREWYNGYLFGEERVYNPWSIIHHCKAGKLEGFWIGTSANILIKELLKNADGKIYDIFHDLLKEEKVKVTLNDNMILGKKYGYSEILYLMISSGYLTIDTLGEERKEYYIKIPNREVMEYFEDTFAEIASSDVVDDFTLIKEALIKIDIEGLEKNLQEMFLNNFSYLDLTREEKFYHTIVLSTIGRFKSRYYTHSNRESGLGRYDLALEPRDKNETGYIFEFKIVPKEDYLKIERTTTYENEDEQKAKLQAMMDNLGMEALSQIDRKLYDTEMRSRGISKIIKIGMVFCGKQVKLYTN